MATIKGTGKNDTINCGNDDDFIFASMGNDKINGRDGFDVVSYQAFIGPVEVNLATGIIKLGEKTDKLTGIEMVIGTEDNDRFTGAIAGDSWFQGGRGNDRLVGGNGYDWSDYFGSKGGMTVDLINGTSSGYDGNDTLINIDNVRGSRFSDKIWGDAGDNRLRGMGGNDYLSGGGGFDLADYRNASGSVSVNLKTGIATGADGRDTLVGIEGIRGSFYGDTLVGDGSSNFFECFGGRDLMTGGAGRDYFHFYAGTGRDTITDFVAKGAERDVLQLGDIYTIASYSDLVANHLSKSGNDAVIDMLNGDVIVLKNVSASLLSSSNFEF